LAERRGPAPDEFGAVLGAKGREGQGAGGGWGVGGRLAVPRPCT